jgi:hypothetical protein
VNGLFGALGVKQPIFVTGWVWPKKRVFLHTAPIFYDRSACSGLQKPAFSDKNGHFFVSAPVF